MRLSGRTADVNGRRRRRAPGHTTRTGYDGAHRRIRRQVAKHVATGTAVCRRCHLPIHPLARWHLGHDDRYLNAKQAHRYRGLEHAACSHASGGWKSEGVLHPTPLRGRQRRRRRLLLSGTFNQDQVMHGQIECIARQHNSRMLRVGLRPISVRMYHHHRDEQSSTDPNTLPHNTTHQRRDAYRYDRRVFLDTNIARNRCRPRSIYRKFPTRAGICCPQHDSQQAMSRNA